MTIAYGGDHALVTPADLSSQQIDAVDKPFYLALCRIEPENNIALTLRAFSETGDRLIFIGNWSSSEYGKRLRNEFFDTLNILLLDPIYDERVLSTYRSRCLAYVHGHSAGGTNPSLVEMMHFEKPIIAFDCVYNRATMEDKGQYFSSSSSLSKSLKTRKCFEGGEELGDIARRCYTWNVVRDQYWKLFKSK